MGDAAPDLNANTRLAMQRNVMAADRTLMAWIRTSLSLIGFGFTLSKVFQSLAERNVFVKGPAGKVWSPEAVGMALLSLGVVALIAAVFNHHHDMKELRAAGLKKRLSLTTAVASALAVVGCWGLLSVTTRH